ncbi:unnamed protein product [Mytilus coruscus]|uniref:Protein MMS22-like n=1 Tax=Mytilus coruscus TaxID=42192 RepID=A0A6J8E8K8_MYTCO|nr:unnamed protein product [Mytilus coruscus]
MSSLDDWSPPVSPSIIAAMEVDVIPETCPSQTEDYYALGNRSNTVSPSKLSDIGDVFGQEQNLDDFPITSTQFDNLNDGQSSPLRLLETEVIPDSIMVEEQTIQDDFRPVPFCCKKSRGQTLDRIKAFKRFLQEPDTALSEDVTEVFTSNVVLDTIPEKIGHLFYRLKQLISKICHGNLESDTEYYSSREQIITFYSFLKRFLYRLPRNLNGEEEEIIQRIVTLLHSVVMYVDRLSDMKYDITLSSSSCDYNRFHLNLDLYWNTLEILCLLEDKFTDPLPLKKISSSYSSDGVESRSLLPQMVQIVVWELVAIAISNFQKKNSQDLIHSSPFDCSCVQDIWKLLACLLNHKGESFWVNLHEVIQTLLGAEIKLPEDVEIDSDVYMYPPVDNLTLNDNSKFCIWMITNVAIVVRGNEDDKIVTASNYYDVNAVIKKVVNKGEVNELDLRFYLRCCQQLCTIWEPNINLLVIFWDYFYKRMNSTFQLKTVSIDSLQTVSKTAVDLLEKCKKCSSGQKTTKQNETSYQLYLGLLGNHLRRLVETHSMQEWKQMKGRIYSKFHQRRIQELTETGLNNFTSLFLSLALTADLEDVSTKLSGFYDMIDVNRQNVGKLTMTWKGMFALMLLYLERNMDVKFIATKIATSFSNICLEFEVFESDPGFRHSLWKLINVYLDGTQEVFDSSKDVCLSQYLLIGEGYSKLLKTCRNNEVPTVISGLQDIISKVRLTTLSDKRDVFNVTSGNFQQAEVFHNAVFSNIYPPVRDLCQSQTAQVQLADILAEISLLALDSKPDDYFTVMKLMLNCENINKNIVCRYLSHIVTVDNALDLLSSHMTNYQTALIQTWIRCAVLVPASSQQLQALNRCAVLVPASSQQLQALNRSMLNLPAVQGILNRASYIVPDEHDKIIFHVFKAIQNLYDKLENWKEKIELRDQVTEYVKDIHRHIMPFLQTFRPVETLSTAYSVIGYLFKCCAHLLYVKSKPNCPLPDIINTMIVPHTLFKKDKPMSPVFLGIIRDHLHLFVSGLANLDFKRDPFIQRRLKDIVTIYLVKFWNSAGSTSSLVHPLVMSLKGSYGRQPLESSVSFRQYIFELVKETFMVISPTYNLPENYQMSLYFTRDVINRTVNKEVIASDLCILVCPVLSIHLQCDSISTQHLCQTILQQMVDAGSSHPHVGTKEVVGEQLMNFLSKFKKNMSLWSMNPSEGTGQDTKLRQTYHSLIETFNS